MKVMSAVRIDDEIIKAVDLVNSNDDNDTDTKVFDNSSGAVTRSNQKGKTLLQQLKGKLSKATQKFVSQIEEEEKGPILSKEKGKALLDSLKKKEDVLPIDAHKDIILSKITSDRVIIIHGETG